jgi:anti-sigma regulatory factor (Ser/Thr protein kinase)
MEVNMASAPQFVLDLSESSDPGQARREISRCAESWSMQETDRGGVAIAVTEMATNVIKHAKHGKIICEPVGNNGSRGLRVIAVDAGPGIRDVATALVDGYSTAGTAGNGLGAVKRLSTYFDIYTGADRGTCVMAEFWPHKKSPANAALQLGVVCVPVRGETVCGDGWNVKAINGRTTLMLVDGLGHGFLAAEAAREAEAILAEAESASPCAILRDCHDALKKTRGAAVAVAAIDHERRILTFCGLGNISASLLTPEGSRGIASHNGTVGHTFHHSQEFTFPWNENSVLVMHSDGLGSRWDLDRYPGLSRKHPSLMAAVLYRDFARERDDVTVLVAKNRE